MNPYRAVLFIFSFGFLLMFWPTKAQQNSQFKNWFDANVAVKDVPVNDFLIADTNLFIKLRYATDTINQQQIDKFKAFNPNKIIKITLVCSKYPYDLTTWFPELTHNRFTNLFSIVPGFKTAGNIEFEVVLLTGINSKADALMQPHGFKVTVAQATHQNTEFVKQFITLNGGNRITDSAVYRVLERHPEWDKCLVVMDWTSSMYHNGSLAILWHILNLKKSGIKYFCFFNDGDAYPDRLKQIGQTGGVYGTYANQINDLLKLMSTVQSRGYGGDGPENDIEAILFGLEKCPDCQEVILVADNASCIRDFKLLSHIKKPVRIITCGTHYYADPDYETGRQEVIKVGINPQYLSLARFTKGSVHTVEDDIDRLIQETNTTIEINRCIYKLVNKTEILEKKEIQIFEIEEYNYEKDNFFLQGHFDCDRFTDF